MKGEARASNKPRKGALFLVSLAGNQAYTVFGAGSITLPAARGRHGERLSGSNLPGKPRPARSRRNKIDDRRARPLGATRRQSSAAQPGADRGKIRPLNGGQQLRQSSRNPPTISREELRGPPPPEDHARRVHLGPYARDTVDKLQAGNWVGTIDHRRRIGR